MIETKPDLMSQIHQYFKQQIELYGDELAIEKTRVANDTRKAEKEPETLVDYYAKIKNCQNCPLGQKRQHFVFGTGAANAIIMLIGEAPGADEDRTGEPFVGPAGQLLDKILKAINLDRKQVYLTNIIKCRPPNNRDPLPTEIEKCLPYLVKQIEFIRPKFILALGRISAQTLLNTTVPIHQLRGKVSNYQNAKLIVTYHPAALLRQPGLKVETWEDVKLLRRLYDTLLAGK